MRRRSFWEMAKSAPAWPGDCAEVDAELVEPELPPPLVWEASVVPPEAEVWPMGAGALEFPELVPEALISAPTSTLRCVITPVNGARTCS